jgi:glycosyltransferase involved in cell wall biosynthesis
MSKTKISALIHTYDSARSLGRALDSLRPCDEVIVVDHDSKDETVKVAKEHGAKVINAVPGVDRGAYAQDARNQWVLCLMPEEALAEELEASLFEWSEAEQDANQMGFNMAVREQNGAGWKSLDPEMRLANRKQINWTAGKSETSGTCWAYSENSGRQGVSESTGIGKWVNW